MKKRLQIYVASTYADMKEERQAAVEAIVRMRHIPAGMEIFASNNKELLKINEKWISDCDLFLLLLGPKYGAIDEESGLGYLEIEYDFAIRHKKPILSIALSDQEIEARIMKFGKHYFEAQNPDKLRKFRHKVMRRSHILINDNKDVKSSIYEALLETESNDKLKGLISSDYYIDAAPLLDEIKRLKEENINLQKNLIASNQKIKILSTSLDAEEALEIAAIMSSTFIDVDLALTSGKKEKQEFDLLRLFYEFRKKITLGIENKPNADSVESFLFFKVAPYLEIHELVEKENMEGAKHKRYVLTGKGRRFLAFYEKAKRTIE